MAHSSLETRGTGPGAWKLGFPASGSCRATEGRLAALLRSLFLCTERQGENSRADVRSCSRHHQKMPGTQLICAQAKHFQLPHCFCLTQARDTRSPRRQTKVFSIPRFQAPLGSLLTASPGFGNFWGTLKLQAHLSY